MQKKDLTTGLALTFFLTFFGMIYTSVVGFVTFLIINVFLIILLLLVGLDGASVPIFRFCFLIVWLLELYWTYNVLMEKNKRIENKEIPMTGTEEFDLGFVNITIGLLGILASIFFSCCLYALLSVTHILDKTSDTLQGIIFFIALIVFFLGFLFFEKNKKLA